MCLYLSFSHICQVSEQSSVGCRPQLHHPRQWGPQGAGVASSCLEQVVVLSHSVVSDSATAQTKACQAPLSLGFPRQEFWRG